MQTQDNAKANSYNRPGFISYAGQRLILAVILIVAVLWGATYTLNRLEIAPVTPAVPAEERQPEQTLEPSASQKELHMAEKDLTDADIAEETTDSLKTEGPHLAEAETKPEAEVESPIEEKPAADTSIATLSPPPATHQPSTADKPAVVPTVPKPQPEAHVASPAPQSQPVAPPKATPPPAHTDRHLAVTQPESQPAPAPRVQQPAPAPHAQQPAPAPHAQQPAPAPHVQQPAPAPHVQQPAPAPHVQQPAPAPHVQQPAPAPHAQQPAPAPHVQYPAPAPHIQQPPPHVPEPKHKYRPVGVTFVEAVIQPIDHELNQRFWGWRPNDIINLTDNVNNYQLGVLEVTRRTAVQLAERISRTGSTDAFNRNLENAMNWLMVKADRYWFPAPESKYTESLKELEEYKETLINGKASFYTRTDNLIPLLTAYEDLLGSCDENLVKHSEVDGSKVSMFKADDYFYYAKGVAGAMAVILEAVHHDFAQTLENRNGSELLHHAVESCRIAAELDPLFIIDSDLDGLFANHRANMAAPISHARFYIGQLIKTLST